MAPSPFRSTAVVCSIVTASLGFGLLTPTVATAAAPTPASASSSAPTRADDALIPSLPVDPKIPAAQVVSIQDTTVGSRAVMGFAGSDWVYLLDGDTVVSAWPGGAGVFTLRALDKYSDRILDIVRVHVAADGKKTRTERTPLPRTLHVDGLEETNQFVPGTQEFAGTAAAGATITATDADDTVLFTTKASDARSAAGSWNAEADFDAKRRTITFTQTLPDGQSTVINAVRFTPQTGDTPNAPEVGPADRRLDGDFTVWGEADANATKVEVRDAHGTLITETPVVEERFVTVVPQKYLGTTVEVVAIAADGSESKPSSAELQPLPVDEDVAMPALKEVIVHPNGKIQLIGEREKSPGVQVLDGDRVVASFQRDQNGWSFTIGPEYTGQQLDLVNLDFDGQRYAATSERLALPRLLAVDGLAEENTYVPGEREFRGLAEAGATVVAKDKDGTELFRAQAKQTRSGVAEWTAKADLSSRNGYDVTFTQTTADGRVSVMKNISFTPQSEEVQPLEPVTVHTETITPGVVNKFAGTATPNASIRVLNAWGTQIVPGTITADAEGTWSFERVVSKGATTFDFAIEQTSDGRSETSRLFRLQAAPSVREVSVTTTSVSAGTVNTFRGTATPNASIRVLNAWGTQIVPGTITADAEGTWTFERVVSKGATKFDFAIEQTVAGVADTSRVFSIHAS
ncbi:hypothetical protein [Curtobacterium sp. 24E2]|nr:hypothetical protein JN350_05265 [Curtobacterium sp. 24E2]